MAQAALIAHFLLRVSWVFAVHPVSIFRVVSPLTSLKVWAISYHLPNETS